MKKKAWRLFSRARREQSADFHDFVECYTCRRKVKYYQAHIGHFKHGKLDFDRIFTQIQCPQCNLWGHGKLDIYAQRLIEDYGLELFKLKVLESNTHKGYSREDLETIIATYGPLIK